MTISLNAGAMQAEAGGGEAGASRYAKWVIAIFFVTLFIPGYAQIGIRMTPYRLFLILMAIPMVLRIRSDRSLRITSVDVFMFLAILWITLSLVVNHGTARLVYAGSMFLELFCGYLLGRAFIRSEADYRFFFKCLLLTLVAFAPFALLELTGQQRVLRDLASAALAQPEITSHDQIRFGLMRVMLSFEHALHFGTFCAIGFANAFYLNSTSFLRRYLACAFILFMSLLPLSSSAILIMILQIGMIGYDRTFAFLKDRWVILAVVILAGVLSFHAIVGRSIPDYIVNELIISPDGGKARLEQFEYAIQEVYRNPIFGLGLNDWRRPFWRGHASLDNFWLVIAMQSGVPALLFLVSGFLIHLLKVVSAKDLSPGEAWIRTGYVIALASILLVLVTYHIWGVIAVFVLLYVGAGAWFYDHTHQPVMSDARRRALERRAAAAAAPTAARAAPGAVPRTRPAAPAAAARRRPGASGRGRLRTD